MRMFCPHCGAQQPEGTKFCTECGKPLGAAPEATQQNVTQATASAAGPANPQPQPAPQQPKPQETGRPQRPEQPQPAPQPADNKPGKPKTNYKMIAIVAGAIALIIAIAIGVTIVAGSSKGDPSKSGTAEYVGSWHMVYGTADGLDRGSVADAASQGIVVTLEIKDDGTTVYDSVTDVTEGKWGIKGTDAWMSFGGSNMNELTLSDDGSALTVFNTNGKKSYTFEKGKEYKVSAEQGGSSSGGHDTIITDGHDTIITDGNDTIITDGNDTIITDSGKGSNSSSSSASSSSSSSATKDAGTMSIGNQKVGYLTVPSLWYDRTSDLDPNMVDAYETVYFVDSDSVFSSTVSSGRAWAKSAEMTVRPASYAQVADETVQKYKGDTKTYGEVSVTDTELGGRKAKLISTSMPNDKGVQIRTLVVDRDGDGKTAVSLAFNAGYNDKEAKEVLDSIASTWKMK